MAEFRLLAAFIALFIAFIIERLWNVDRSTASRNSRMQCWNGRAGRCFAKNFAKD
ncbi:MAG: hypothetical protein SNJ57_15360 [Cyanobacteriota bacterium]